MKPTRQDGPTDAVDPNATSRICELASLQSLVNDELSEFSSQTGRARGYATAPAAIPKEAERGERLPS